LPIHPSADIRSARKDTRRARVPVRAIAQLLERDEVCLNRFGIPKSGRF
jgi:hypothetical protein